MYGSRWLRSLLVGYGLLLGCITPVSVAAQDPGFGDAPSIYLRLPQPTPRLVVKQRLDEVAASIVAAPQANEQAHQLMMSKIFARAYSAFGYPAEAWDLFSRHPDPAERGYALQALASDGNASFVSDMFAAIPDSDQKKCALADLVASNLDGYSKEMAKQFRARHGCARTKPSTATSTPERPTALEQLRARVALTCDGKISTDNGCRMDHVLYIVHYLGQTATTSQFSVALQEISKIRSAELRARVLWMAMVHLSHSGQVQALHDVFAMIQSLAAENGAQAVLSELASGQALLGGTPCLLEGVFKGRARPMLAGRPFSPGFGDCSGPRPETLVLSAILTLEKRGHRDIAQRILDWYQSTAVPPGDPNKLSSRVVDAIKSNQFIGVTDVVGLAITHAYMGNADVAHYLLRHYDPNAQALDPSNALWLAFLGQDEILPTAFRRIQSERFSSSTFACAWLRGRALANDISSVAQIAKLLEPDSAARCLADAITMAAVNAIPISDGMAGLVLAKDSPFRPISSRAWTRYTVSLIAAGFNELAEHAMAACIEEGISSYDFDLDQEENRDVWNGTLATHMAEMLVRGHGALIRSLLPRAPSDAARSMIVLRLAAALADQGLWQEVVPLNEWADPSRVPRAAAPEAPWNIIAQSYARAGDMEMVFKLIQLGFVAPDHLGYIVAVWRNGGRIVGP